jgi:hypothetical protein
MEVIRKAVYSIAIPEAMQEAILEGLRLAVFALVSTLVAYLLTMVKSYPNPEVWTMVLTLVLRMVDKWAHEKGKAGNVGIVGF